MSGISKDTFGGYTVDSKLDTLFDIQNDIKDALESHPGNCNDRFTKLEDKKAIVTVTTGVVATVAAVAAVLAKLKPWG